MINISIYIRTGDNDTGGRGQRGIDIETEEQGLGVEGREFLEGEEDSGK